MNAPIPLPKSPLSDEQYQQLTAWYNNRAAWSDMIDRMERANIMNADQIRTMRDQLENNVRQVKSVLDAFADLHRL